MARMKALILGGASCLWDDADKAARLSTYDAIFAVNNAITDWPGRLDYAVSLHQEPTKHYPGLVKAVEKRRDKHRPQVWSHKPGRGVDRTTADWGGSSGLFAVRVALEEGFTRIVLAGVPMTVEGEHYHARGKWTACANYRKRWIAHHSQLDGKVKSLSGWTKEQLGEPTPAWINSD